MKNNIISFDLWDTLIKGRTNHKGRRSDYFFKHFNGNNWTAEEIRTAVAKVDKDCNILGERTGIAIHSELFIYKSLVVLGIPETTITPNLIANIRKEINTLFLDNLPELYDTDTLEVIKELSKNNTLLSVSNTGFIGHAEVRVAMLTLGLGQHFDAMIFSDATGYSKPNPKIIGDNQNIINIHVGDRPFADGEFAKAIGADFFLVNAEGAPSIKELLNFVENKNA